MQAGEVISEAWGLYRTHWRHLLPIAAAFYIVIAVGALVLTIALGPFGALLALLASIVGYFWLAGALTEAVADIRDGRADLSLQETLTRVRPLVWRLLGAGLLAALGIILGLVLLIVPGLILLTWWSLISAVIVLEQKPAMESFGRSRELVRGHGWSVFGVVIITVVISMLVGIAVSILLVWLPEEVRSFVSQLLSGTLTAPFVALAWTLMYFRLRQVHEVPAEPSPAQA